MIKLYLDIEGTLVRGGEAAEGAAELLLFAVRNFECFWLSTHCHGDTTETEAYLLGKFPKEIHSSIRLVKPTLWGMWKTDAIDFSGPFFWLDNRPSNTDLDVLRKYGAENQLILIDLVGNPSQLLSVKMFLENILKGEV